MTKCMQYYERCTIKSIVVYKLYYQIAKKLTQIFRPKSWLNVCFVEDMAERMIDSQQTARGICKFHKGALLKSLSFPRNTI